MDEALRIIISRSSHAAREAMKTLQAIRVNSPIVQMRYNNTVQIAFDDPGAEFTADERSIISQYIELPENAERMVSVIRVRVTDSERLELEQAATASGMNLSEYIRHKLFTQEDGT